MALLDFVKGFLSLSQPDAAVSHVEETRPQIQPFTVETLTTESHLIRDAFMFGPRGSSLTGRLFTFAFHYFRKTFIMKLKFTSTASTIAPQRLGRLIFGNNHLVTSIILILGLVAAAV